MAKKTPDAYAEFMKMYDPENISKMFNPQAMMEHWGVKTPDFDPQEAVRKAQDKFDAMAKANEAAAASYRDLMEKQMQIFQDVTAEAAEHIKSSPAQDAAEVYHQAVKRALEVMTELSENVRHANEQAYAAIRTEVEKTIKELPLLINCPKSSLIPTTSRLIGNRRTAGLPIPDREPSVPQLNQSIRRSSFPIVYRNCACSVPVYVSRLQFLHCFFTPCGTHMEHDT